MYAQISKRKHVDSLPRAVRYTYPMSITVLNVKSYENRKKTVPPKHIDINIQYLISMKIYQLMEKK